MSTDDFQFPLFDDGPKEVAFSKIRTDLLNKNTNLENILLPYYEEFEYKAMELSRLLLNYQKISKEKEQFHRHLTKTSVLKWIFFTNKLEFAGLETEQDTEECLSKSIEEVDETPKKEVIQMYSALKESYKPIKEPMEISSHLVDVTLLKKYHRIMLKDIYAFKGKEGNFRKSGAESYNLDKTKHKFLHHEFIESLMETLLGLVYKLSKNIEKIDQKEKRDEFICKTVGLASFFQFHFVDIHPFSDGNGRMCRLLSKIILDSIFPIPIPMFENREDYLISLIEGRKMNHLRAPTKLASLIFDVSINYYKGILKILKHHYT